jgi:hypothetical protein
MVQGTILKKARSDNRFMLGFFVVLVALSGAAFWWQSKFIYNFVAGPAPFTKTLAAAPGMREFVRAEGTLVSTGSKEATIWRWAPRRGVAGAIAKASGRSLAESETITANFMAMMIDGGVLVVKVSPDFSGRVVEGKLVPLPEEFRAAGRAMTDADGAEGDEGVAAAAATVIHPQMIDATHGYRGLNLIALAAVIMLPLSVAGLVWSARAAGNVSRHPAIARVAKKGPYMALIPRIERELAAAGDQGHIGPLWIGPNWIVVLASTLNIFPVADIVGIGHESKSKKETDKTTTVTHKLVVWMRDEVLDYTVDMTEGEARRAMPLLTALHPSLIVDDVALLRKRWSSDREECVREMAAARRAAAAAAPAASGA